VDKLTVKEACTVLGIKERTAYKYIRRLKIMNLPDIFNKRAGYSREKQLEGLADQLAAINLK
jgi:predicted site-specific integrase-resolvase